MKKRKLSKFLLCLAAGIAVAIPLIGEKFALNAAEENNSTVQLINPVAKYEFKDASNPGKDTMGNYDLNVKVTDGQTSGNVTVSNGVASFDGTAGLTATMEHDIGDNLNAFTLCFDIMQPQAAQNWWVYPIGFGWGGHDQSEFFGFNIQGDTSYLRFNDWNNYIGNQEPFWQHEVGLIKQDQFTNVTLSVEPGEQLNIYFGGQLKVSYAVPSTFTNANSVKTFGIGGLSMWGNVYNPWIGQMKNVQIYNVAMSASEVASYIQTGTLYREVIQQEITDELKPVAKYEFNDANNPGKDTMGNYNLAKSGDGTIGVENGIATFNGTAGLISNPDISEDLESFSLVFDIKTTATYGDWAEPIGFGWDNWTPTNWNTFQFSAGSDLLRFGAKGMGASANQFWLDEVGSLGTSNFSKVALSVNKNGNTVVYLNGTAVKTYTTPADFSLDNGNMFFALGGNGSWGSVSRCMWQGQMDTVAIYDFALSTQQVRNYNANGKVTVSDLTSEKYINAVDAVNFAGNETTANLYSNMPTNDMFKLLNPATAVATLSDETTINLPLTWTSVVQEEDKYYAVGTTKVVGQSIPTKVSRTTVKHELTVYAYDPSCVAGVNTYMNLGYKYTATTEDEVVTYSNVEFRLRVGYDASITAKAEQYGATEYGVEVSTNAKTMKFAYTLETKLDEEANINYVIVGLGDVINNTERATTVFTVKAYMVVNGMTYYSEVVKSYSVAEMVAEYYAQEKPVDGVYYIFTQKGLYQ